MNPNRKEIPWFFVVIGFAVAWPIGLIMLFYNLFRENGEKPQQSGTQRGARTYVPSQQAQQSRTYTPPQHNVAQQAAPQGKRGVKSKYSGYHAYESAAYQAPPRRLERKLSGRGGKLLWGLGGLVLAGGAFAAAVVFLSEAYYGWFFDGLYQSAIVAFCTCAPGAALALLGGRIKNRASRCRTYLTMLGSRRSIDLREAAAAIPTTVEKAKSDVQWMIDQGFFPGAYIDARRQRMVYAGEPIPEPEEPVREQAPEPEPQAAEKTRSGMYLEEQRIRSLNVMIADEYVSQRMDRLAELTHNIFAYVEENPGKESRIRQFKQHYLPKTIKILQSYARMEKQGINGANIKSAMSDIEQIMDTLVSGFEKQLDILFDDEVLDITTDINVLENMMTLEGLMDDPFRDLGRDVTHNG